MTIIVDNNNTNPISLGYYRVNAANVIKLLVNEQPSNQKSQLSCIMTGGQFNT
jgi:hypothetical protein